MKTEVLISLLAASEKRVPKHAIGQRFAVSIACSAPFAIALMVIVFGVRDDLTQAVTETMFWMKLAFAGGLALFASLSTEKLGRPGMPLGMAWTGLTAPLVLLWLVAIVTIVNAEPAQRADLVFGRTWQSCPLNIALIAVPFFAATIGFMKGLAPTQLTLAGASAGLLAGAFATLVYAFHCTESSAAFVGIWYVMGIAIPAIVGAVIGPRLLRW